MFSKIYVSLPLLYYMFSKIYVSLPLLYSMFSKIYVSLPLLYYMFSKIYVSLPGYELYLYCTLCLVRSMYLYHGMKSTSIVLYVY